VNVSLVISALLGIIGFIVFRALRVAEHVIEDEVKARLPYAATRMLERAIETAPAEYREDRRQEWTAELVALEGQGLRAVWFARQCMKAATTEAREYGAEPSADGSNEPEAETASSESRTQKAKGEPVHHESPRQPRPEWDRAGAIAFSHLARAFLHLGVLFGVTAIVWLTPGLGGSPPLVFSLVEVVIITSSWVFGGVSRAVPMLVRSLGLPQLEGTMDVLGKTVETASRVATSVLFALQFVALLPLLDATGGVVSSPFATLALAIAVFAVLQAGTVRGALAALVCACVFFGFVLDTETATRVAHEVPASAFFETNVLVLALAAMFWLVRGSSSIG
jgi:hypothetical protein